NSPEALPSTLGPSVAARADGPARPSARADPIKAAAVRAPRSHFIAGPSSFPSLPHGNRSPRTPRSPDVTDGTGGRWHRSRTRSMLPRSLNPSASNDTQEAMEMLTGEMAKYRIDDRVRAAQTDRLARSTRAGRTANAR